VQQTVLALLARGLAVTVVRDAVASRRDLDRRVALARLVRAGAALADAAALLDTWSEAPVPLPPPAG
jgi:nicotinamidase-related amidase